jgi:hypothetical protein
MYRQIAAFASGVLPDIYVFHYYTGNSAILSDIQDLKFRLQFQG